MYGECGEERAERDGKPKAVHVLRLLFASPPARHLPPFPIPPPSCAFLVFFPTTQRVGNLPPCVIVLPHRGAPFCPILPPSGPLCDIQTSPTAPHTDTGRRTQSLTGVFNGRFARVLVTIFQDRLASIPISPPLLTHIPSSSPRSLSDLPYISPTRQSLKLVSLSSFIWLHIRFWGSLRVRNMYINGLSAMRRSLEYDLQRRILLHGNTARPELMHLSPVHTAR